MLLAVLAVVAVVRRRVERPAALLGAGALLMLVGYLAFWGAWNAAELWGGTRYVGPFYVMPVLVPLVLLGARALVDLFEAPRRAGRIGRSRRLGPRRRPGGHHAGSPLFPANATMSGHDRKLEDLVQSQGRSLIFLPSNPPYLQHPSAVLDNGLRPDGRTVFALTRGVARLPGVADEPGRSLLRLRVLGLYNKSPRSALRGVARAGPRAGRGPGGAADDAGAAGRRDSRRSACCSPSATGACPGRSTRPGSRSCRSCSGPDGPTLPGQGAPIVETGPVPDPALKPEIESAAPGALVVTLLGRKGTGRERLLEQDRIAYRPGGRRTCPCWRRTGWSPGRADWTTPPCSSASGP